MAWAAESNVAEVNGKKYATLAEAVAAAKDGDTVTLLKDCEITDTITLDKNISIVGGGKKLTMNAGSEAYAPIFYVKSGATLSNIKFDYKGTGADDCAVYLDGTVSGFTADGCSFTGDASAAGIIGSFGVKNVTVKNSSFSILKYGMYLNSVDTATIENNTFDSIKYNAINFAATNATYPCKDITLTGNTMTSISIANYPGDLYSAGISFGQNTQNATIASGNISMACSKKAVYAEAGAVISITGGTFSSNPIDYVVKGYAVSKNGDTYTVAAVKDTAAVKVTNNDGAVTVANIVVNEEAGTNTIDVKSCEATSVTATKEVLATVVKADATKPVAFKLNTNTSVEFNTKAVKAIAGNMGGNDDITLVVTPNATVTNEKELTAKGKVANTNTEIVTLELKQGAENLFTKSEGAKATVTVPFAMPAGCNRVNVYYLNSTTGAAEYVGTASTANGTAAFTVEHFSSYALVPTYVGGSGSVPSGHTMTTNLSGITTVYVDGKKVDSKNYTISGGNVTLTQAYLNTLSAGKHTFKAENATHIATGTFNVAKGAVSPQTADAGIAIYGMMSIMSLMGMGYIGKKKSR